jgi:acetyltransferase
VDIPAVARVVVQIGRLMEAFPEIGEVDINPLVALEHGAIALDALLVR